MPNSSKRQHRFIAAGSLTPSNGVQYFVVVPRWRHLLFSAAKSGTCTGYAMVVGITRGTKYYWITYILRYRYITCSLYSICSSQTGYSLNLAGDRCENGCARRLNRGGKAEPNRKDARL